MLKQRARLLAVSVFLLDLGLVAGAFVVSYALRNEWLPRLAPTVFQSSLYPLASYLPLLPIALLIWATLLPQSGRYRSHRTVPLVDEARAVIQVCITAGVVLTLVIFAFRLDLKLLAQDRISRSWLFLWVVVACVFLLVEKLALRVTSRYVRERGFNYRTVLIIGTNESAFSIARSIEDHPYWGYRILGFIRRDSEKPHPNLSGAHILGDVSDVERLVAENVVDDVFFAVHRRDISELEDLFLRLHEQGIRTRFVLNPLPHGSARLELEEIDGLPMLSVSPTPTSFPLLVCKRTVDVTVAVAVFVLGLPVVLAVALLIKLTSSGSVLYRQTRCGLNGRRFTLYKFRTMIEDAEALRPQLAHLNEMSEPAFKMRRDPRVTPVGRILRKFSLDELPQLWNVLRGDMSLVGPRPPIPEEVAKYSRWQRRRLSMKPGLTCLWQISGRNNLDFNRWIELDLEYIDSWSPMLDFKILLKTIPVVLTGRGAS